MTLLDVPSGRDVGARVVALTDAMIRRGMGSAWWDDPVVDPELAAKEIDQDWDWAELAIERGGRVLASRKLAVVTADGVVQGAAMCSTEPVACARRPDRGRPAVFVELLFVSPANRPWVRRDGAERFRGIGLHMLRVAAMLSVGAGCAGRLKLDASPGFVGWYKKRGLLVVPGRRILHEGVHYTPMELSTDRVPILLPEQWPPEV